MSVPPLCVSHLTALDASPEAFVRAAAAAGFASVGLRINPPPHTPAQWPLAGDGPRTRALRRVLDDCGTTVVECEGFSIRPDFAIAAMAPGLDASAALGCRYILSAGMDTDEARMVDHYGALCAAAAPLGLKVGMEFISWNPLRTLGDALRVLAKVRAPNAGILIDFLHLARTGGTPEEVAAVPMESIAYSQICDAAVDLPIGMDLPTEARTHRFYPGDGGLPVAAILAALPPGIPLTLEAPSARHLGQSMQVRLEAAARTLGDFLAAHPQRRPATP